MRKKIKLLVISLLIVAILASTFAGCTLITKNKDREANESLTTITRHGITLEISKNSFLDYFNTIYSQNAQYIQQGYFSVEQILDSAIEGKMKNTYLLADAMVYLTDKNKVGDVRVNVLNGKGKKVKLEDVLTYAEWAEAVHSVNKSINEQIDSAKENAYQTKLDQAWRKVRKTDVKGIEFTEETKKYLQDSYYENDNIDFDKIKVVVIYDEEIEIKKNGETVKENKKSEPIIPSKVNFSKEFTTTFGQQDQDDEVEKTFEITFNETFEGIEKEDEAHTISHTYTLKKSRATKNKKDELEGVLDKIKIGDITVGRYDTKAQLKEKGIDLDGTDEDSKLYKIRDLNKETQDAKSTISDIDLVEGYRVVNERMKTTFKTMNYYYHSAFEIAVTNALRSEIHQRALDKYKQADLEKDIINELKYLYEKDKAKYGTDLEKNKKDFKKAITEKVDSVYYHPKMDDVTENFYVYNLLFKFSPENEKFISDKSTDKETLEGYREYIKGKTVTNASNPNYDVEHKCPLHHEHKEGEKCSFSEDETGIKDGKICPSVRYGRIDAGKLKIFGVDEEYEEKIEDVISRLQDELVAVQNDAEKTAEEKVKSSVEIFEKYMYTYNDDAGVMNNVLGYYATSESFQKGFIDLSKEVWAYSPNVGNAFASDGKLGLGYSSYGVHIVMISATPFKNAKNDQALTFVDDSAMIEYYKNEYDVEGNSIYKNIEKKLKDRKKNQRYSDFTKARIPLEIIERNEKNNKVTLNKELKNEVKIDAKKLKKIFDLFLKNKR